MPRMTRGQSPSQAGSKVVQGTKVDLVPQENFSRAGSWALLASFGLLGEGDGKEARGWVPAVTAKCHWGLDKG